MPKTKAFIEKARAKHGDRYDYGKVVYVRSKDKVIITCEEHGDFEQRAYNHTRGDGCPACNCNGGYNKSNTMDFIEKAVAKHGYKYSYLKTIYSTAREKVTITCSAHGDFQQIASNHLHGYGCQGCAGNMRYAKGVFLNLARAVHGDRYTYCESDLDSITAGSRITVRCITHGDFEQRASEHINQQSGCPNCGGRYPLNLAELISRSKAIHGDAYVYDNAEYVNTKTKVAILCREHGEFHQTPEKHFGDGNGCPRCQWDRDQPTAVYLMQMGAQVKIGISIDPDARLSQLNRNNPAPARIITTWTLEDFPAAHAMEQRIHRKLKSYHAGLTGFDGATEWFDTTPEYVIPIIEKIVNNYT